MRIESLCSSFLLFTTRFNWVLHWPRISESLTLLLHTVIIKQAYRKYIYKLIGTFRYLFITTWRYSPQSILLYIYQRWIMPWDPKFLSINQSLHIYKTLCHVYTLRHLFCYVQKFTSLQSTFNGKTRTSVLSFDLNSRQSRHSVSTFDFPRGSRHSDGYISGQKIRLGL